MKTKIIDYIIENELNKPTRHREYVYRRAFLCNLLRDEGCTLQAIATVFKRTHATVLHLINLHKNYYSKRDVIYLAHIQLELEHFRVEPKPNIYDDILNVNNTTDLQIIKERILSNEYY